MVKNKRTNHIKVDGELGLLSWRCKLSERFYHCALVPVMGGIKKVQSDSSQLYPLNAQEEKGISKPRNSISPKQNTFFPIFFFVYLPGFGLLR